MTKDGNGEILYFETIKSALADLENRSIYRFTKTQYDGGKSQEVYAYEWYRYISFQATKMRQFLFDNRKYLQGRVQIPRFHFIVDLWLKEGLRNFNLKHLPSKRLRYIQQAVNQLFMNYLDKVFYSGDSLLCALTIHANADYFELMAQNTGLNSNVAREVIAELKHKADDARNFVQPKLEEIHKQLPQVKFYNPVQAKVLQLKREDKCREKATIPNADNTHIVYESSLKEI